LAEIASIKGTILFFCIFISSLIFAFFAVKPFRKNPISEFVSSSVGLVNSSRTASQPAVSN